jgi:CubicO group peptidase (beta-lactamase class C family)
MNLRQQMMRWCWLLFVTLPAYSSELNLAQSVQGLMQRSAETFHVPGMAVTIVKDGAVVLTQGAGQIGLESDAAVDEMTLFQLGSVSKAFTAASLALLVDEGAIAWDAPVIDYLPEFRMYDPWVTREFTVRDLLTHRSGLPLGAGDLLLHPNGQSTVQDVIRAMRFLQPTSSFRSQYDYDNLMYVIAGEVVSRSSGKTFEEFLEQRLFLPLGMDGCVASVSRTSSEFTVAQPHVFVDGAVTPATVALADITSAAGGVTCNAAGMARWLNFILRRGVMQNGEHLISEEQFSNLIAPVTLLPTPGYLKEYAGASLSAYALGWRVSTFYGEPIWEHSGAVWGSTAYVMVLPESNLAVFASANQMSAAPRALVNDIVDLFSLPAGLADRPDWIAVIDELTSNRRDEGDAVVARAADQRASESKPSLSLAHYAGRYTDPWYGEVIIRVSETGQLWFESRRNPPLNGPLKHFQFDTFVAEWTDRQLMADAYVSFSLSPTGEIESIKMRAVSPNTDFSYDFHDLNLSRVE